MNVLSLFDGMSCGQIALERAGVKVDNYFASEIDKNTIQISKKNNPRTIQLGNVKNWKKWELPKIDLLIGGSPCQGFSFVGKQLNFDDHRSKLFFDFVDVLKHCSPKYFLLENVRMKKEYQDIISESLSVEPIKINSSLLSAQNRVRLYWTNIANIGQPLDKGLVVRDILEESVDGRFYVDIDEDDICRGENSGNMAYVGSMKRGLRLKDGKTLSRNFSQGYRIYGDNGKAQTLVATGVGGIGGFTGTYRIKEKVEKSSYGLVRIGTATDIKGHDYNKRVYGADGKSPCLAAKSGGNLEPKVSVTKNIYRKLTPLECERLQTVPDNYTEGVSNSQRYKMLGNGWTVDVIAHIFKNLPEKFK